jgi:hypothetical protein
MITIPIGPHPTGCDVGRAVSSTRVSPGSTRAVSSTRVSPGSAHSAVQEAAARLGAGTLTGTLTGTPPNQLVIRGTPARGDAMHTTPRT